MPTVTSKASFMCRPFGRLPRALQSGRKGRFADRQGGLGGNANQAFMRASASAAHACGTLHLVSHSHFYFSSFWGYFLDHFTLTSFQLRFPRFIHFAFLCCLFAPIPFLHSCATTKHRDDIIVSTLHAQNALLEKLELDRSALRRSKATVSSSSFREAERHLEESIQALKASNEAISAALSEK